ncbi:MAG: hypothetical protein V1736_08900 [Pseudomonadota bacterium]
MPDLTATESTTSICRTIRRWILGTIPSLLPSQKHYLKVYS